MKALTDLYIFETVAGDERKSSNGWGTLWRSVQPGKEVPFAFARGLRIAGDLMIVSIVFLIGFTTHAPALTIAAMELLFIGIGVFMIVSRILKRFFAVVSAYLAVILLGSMLNLFFPGEWGSVGLYAICVIMLYQFPPRWSLLLAGICTLALISTDGALRLFPFQHAGSLGTLGFSLLLVSGMCWFGWTQRSQYLLVVRLHETQEQLREQMARSEALAAEQERMRIARDIHDVLSHSLAVLSIQVQAARHLMRDPERLSTKLDDMAMLIRESMAESRGVIGMLRESSPTPSKQDELGASLRSVATTFSERTGVSSRFEESGIPRKISSQHREALHLALREMLTNAHRHGAARTVWITLRWQDTCITLQVHDDGLGAKAAQTG